MKLNKILKNSKIFDFSAIPRTDFSKSVEDVYNFDVLYHQLFGGMCSEFTVRYKSKDSKIFLDYLEANGFQLSKFIHSSEWDNANSYVFIKAEDKMMVQLILNDDSVDLEEFLEETGFKSEQPVFSTDNSELISTINLFVDITRTSKDKMKIFQDIVKLFPKEKKKKDGQVFLFETNEKNKITINPHDIQSFDLDVNEHYNDDFAEVDKKINDWITDFTIPNKRLLFLNGEMGCGKTNYIKSLIGKNTKIKKIYVAPQYIDGINDPGFFGILKRYSNSVLILEDCEKILVSRQDNPNNNAISVLLNLSDGILASVLNFKIICTFNTDEKEIDSALTRKGRLFMKYKFGKLNSIKTNKLYNKLYNKAAPTKEMTLAEIFEADDNGQPAKEERRMGFGA